MDTSSRRCIYLSLVFFVSGAFWQNACCALDVMVNVAGTAVPGYSGDGGPATSAQINRPIGVTEDSAGNIYFCDSSNHRVRRVDAATKNINTIAGTGAAGFSGDNGPAASAQLNQPGGLVFDPSGNLYISDFANNRVRMIVAATGNIVTVVGNGSSSYGGDNGPALNAGTRNPASLAIDPIDGALVFTELNTSAIRRVDPTTSIITTLCGNGSNGYNGDNILAVNAIINEPEDIHFDAAGDLIFIDSFNQRIRKITRATGMLSTVAGTGQSGFSGDNGPASEAVFQFGGGSTAGGYFALDSNGNFYISDDFNQRIRYIDHATQIVTTIAGNGSAGYDGDATNARATRLNGPCDIFVETNGNYVFTDFNNNLVRRVIRNAQTLPLALTGVVPPLVGKGLVTVTLQGSGFQSTDAVKLSMAGQPDIAGLVQGVTPAGLTSKVAFVLTNAVSGIYDVVLTPATGTPKTLPAALTITDFGPPLLSVGLGGNAILRGGFAQGYFAVVENFGLTDALGAELSITYPSYVSAAVLSTTKHINTLFPGLSDEQEASIAPDFNDTTQKIMTITLPLVRAGERVPVSISLTAPTDSSYAHRTFDLSASISPPFMVLSPTAQLTSAAGLTADMIVAGDNSYSQYAYGPAVLAQAYKNLGSSFTTPAYLQTVFTNLGLGAPPTDVQQAARIAYFRLRSLECAAAYSATAATIHSRDHFTDDDLITNPKDWARLEAMSLAFGPSPELLAHQEATDWVKLAEKMIKNDLLNDSVQSVEEYSYKFNLSPDRIKLLLQRSAKKLGVEIRTPNDPNDKQGVAGFGDAHFIPQNQELSYTILFENKPDASAPAQVVTVTDVLDGSKIDLNSIQLGAVQFSGHVLTPMPGQQTYHTQADLRPEKNLLLDIQAKLDKPSATLTWTFTSLDPATWAPTTDPAAGFLDPDVISPQGQGSVSFSASMASGDTIGTTISNGATIVFDKNAPISTPVWSNTVADFQTLPLTSFAVKLNFAQAGKDSCSLTGTLPLPSTTVLKGATVLLYCSAYSESFVLDEKGNSPKDKTKTLSIKLGKKTPAKFSGKISGALAEYFGADGLLGGASLKAPKTPNRTVNVALVLNNVVYQAAANMIYSAKQGKSGSGKMAKPTTAKTRQSSFNIEF